MTDADITCVDDSVYECACTENGERDLDCCAEELAAGCLPGYTMTRLTDAGPCWPNTLAYSTCCTPIAGYFEDDASGTGPGFPPRGEGTHMYKADGSTNEPPEWQASYIAQSNSTDGWCASEPHYAEKCECLWSSGLCLIDASARARTLARSLVPAGCWCVADAWEHAGDVECMETSIAFNEGFAALIMAWILGSTPSFRGSGSPVRILLVSLPDMRGGCALGHRPPHCMCRHRRLLGRRNLLHATEQKARIRAPAYTVARCLPSFLVWMLDVHLRPVHLQERKVRIAILAIASVSARADCS